MGGERAMTDEGHTLTHTAGLTDGLGYGGFENKDDVQTLEASCEIYFVILAVRI